MRDSRQRYGILLLALTVTFFFYGIAQPSDLQRAIGSALVGATLLLALNAAEMQPPFLQAAVAVVSAAVVAVIIASAAGMGSTSEAITAVANGLLRCAGRGAALSGHRRSVDRGDRQRGA